MFVQVEIDEERKFRYFAESISRPLLKEPYAVKKEIFFGREEREKEKDSHIVLLEEKDKNNNFMLGKKDEQLKISEELTNSLHKELKGQRTKTFLWKVGTYAGIIASTYLILTK